MVIVRAQSHKVEKLIPHKKDEVEVFHSTIDQYKLALYFPSFM